MHEWDLDLLASWTLLMLVGAAAAAAAVVRAMRMLIDVVMMRQVVPKMLVPREAVAMRVMCGNRGCLVGAACQQPMWHQVLAAGRRMVVQAADLVSDHHQGCLAVRCCCNHLYYEG